MNAARSKCMTNSQRATLARSRIAAACRGDHTAEFRDWRKRTQAIGREYLAGKRERHVETKAAARQLAWVDAEREFCEQHPDRTDTLLGFSTREEDEEPRPLVEDVRWAYRHAMVYSATEVDAPSAGAWLWLLEARENRSRFLGKLFALEQAAHGGKLPQHADNCDTTSVDDGYSIEDLLGP